MDKFAYFEQWCSEAGATKYSKTIFESGPRWVQYHNDRLYFIRIDWSKSKNDGGYNTQMFTVQDLRFNPVTIPVYRSMIMQWFKGE